MSDFNDIVEKEYQKNPEQPFKEENDLPKSSLINVANNPSSFKDTLSICPKHGVDHQHETVNLDDSDSSSHIIRVVPRVASPKCNKVENSQISARNTMDKTYVPQDVYGKDCFMLLYRV